MIYDMENSNMVINYIYNNGEWLSERSSCDQYLTLSRKMQCMSNSN